MKQKRSRERTRHIRNLVLVGSLTAIVLIVSTYAWFIGTQTVTVSSFDIEIAAAESLLLSLDGDQWASTIEISEENLNQVSYANHTNSWGGEKGIFPLSTIGELDSGVSRLKLYEKASLTPTTGGFRIMSSRVDNYTTIEDEDDNVVLRPEADGYVVFDLFIKNISGHQYIETLNELDEEAIFLTDDSAVEVATSGVANTGIENSARVAFAQIGRVSGTTTDPTIITSITCADDAENKITGICRTAQIWEPNDAKHVNNAISWYEEACLGRTGDDVTIVASYTGNECKTVAHGNTYRTYAVASPITSANNVDVYDGTDYNGYTTTTIVPSCTGGTVPVTKGSCLSAYGIWTGTDEVGTCSENNRAYCKAINGTYSETVGTCAEAISNPTTSETCIAAGGKWVESACTGVGITPSTQTACTTAGGTWDETESTCTNTGATYCKNIGGTYTRPVGLLDYYPYFTDTMKELNGTDRPAFMALAPNSITKVRIYVYIEGQDVDNYDFASVGKKIAVNFGFTKERFDEADIDYDGPDLPNKKYTVTFDTDGGTEIESVQVFTRTAVTQPANAPVKEGFTFDHWALVTNNEVADTAYNFETLVGSDITLKAIYTAN